MENRDRMRDQGSPDLPPGKTTPGQGDEGRPDPRRTREEEDRDNPGQTPRRNPQPDQSPPKTA